MDEKKPSWERENRKDLRKYIVELGGSDDAAYGIIGDMEDEDFDFADTPLGEAMLTAKEKYEKYLTELSKMRRFIAIEAAMYAGVALGAFLVHDTAATASALVGLIILLIRRLGNSVEIAAARYSGWTYFLHCVITPLLAFLSFCFFSLASVTERHLSDSQSWEYLLGSIRISALVLAIGIPAVLTVYAAGISILHWLFGLPVAFIRLVRYVIGLFIAGTDAEKVRMAIAMAVIIALVTGAILIVS